MPCGNPECPSCIRVKAMHEDVYIDTSDCTEVYKELYKTFSDHHRREYYESL